MVYDNEHCLIKIAAIIYGIDPQGNIRILMRHNKPYDGKHPDEWTFVWGAVEAGETLEKAAGREAQEEFGLREFVKSTLSPLTSEYIGQHGKSIAHYCLLQVPDVEVAISLNEESIGFDWMLVKDAKKLMREHEREVIEGITQ